MDLIIDFVKKVLNEDGCFTMREEETPFSNERRYSFLQEKVGEAKFIYGEYGYNEDFFISIKKKFELKAIASQGKVYILDMYLLGDYGRAELPENVENLYISIQKLNEKVNAEIFPAFYEGLETVEVENEADCRKRARNALLSGKPEFWIAEHAYNPFDVSDFVKILCGLMNAEEEALRRLEKDRGKWQATKAKDERMQELMVAPGLCRNWELAIAKCLNCTNVANVIVTFEMNGKSASSKLAVDKILHSLMECDNFNDWDFATRKQGTKFLEALGATSRWEGNPLKCEHISKITYGKKVLYERTGE